ncbi:hypothetical protein NEF87_004394 [Candidatus Lokiarchaeum ossiferum]|uniref:Pentapeptide repeat-containing protein n=1 Tax=Candidatus Lokiarchaeum ossiferum TaxID=2951803 RepID=A0ABY6HZW0_9ARCH|nr:hypothetical protein NEF87_004394 [Candidatus Lokiarchaeum sp. B-35]
MDLSEFPESNLPGDDFSDVDYQYMRAAAEQSVLFSKTEWNVILSQHAEFLKTGGGGGKWETMNLNGVILGLYAGPSVSTGAQALLNNRNLTGVNLSNIVLAYANMVGVLAQNQNFSHSNLNHILFTDSFLEGSDFSRTNLMGTDFSRSQLKGCSFRNANLKYCDFENCDLTDVDFTGAKLAHSRFPGAILKNILR